MSDSLCYIHNTDSSNCQPALPTSFQQRLSQYLGSEIYLYTMPEQRWQTFLDELLFFPPGKQFGSSQPSRNNSSHQSQTPSGSYVAPPSTVSISSSHQSPTPFGSHSAPTPTMSIDTSQTPSGRYLFGSGRPSQTPFGGRLAPTVSISSSHQSQTSFGSPTPTVSSHQSQTPSGHSLFGSVRPSQTPFGGHLAPTSTMSISSSHQSQTSFGSPTPTVSIDTGNQSQTLSGGYLYPPSTMSISQTPFASQWSHQSQTSVVRDPQAPSRRTARKQFIDSATGYHRPQMAHDQQSSATGKGSVKYLTCHYYNQGHCRFSAKKCLYSHCQTGKVANAPRQAIAGGEKPTPILIHPELDHFL